MFLFWFLIQTDTRLEPPPFPTYRHIQAFGQSIRYPGTISKVAGLFGNFSPNCWHPKQWKTLKRDNDTKKTINSAAPTINEIKHVFWHLQISCWHSPWWVLRPCFLTSLLPDKAHLKIIYHVVTIFYYDTNILPTYKISLSFVMILIFLDMKQERKFKNKVREIEVWSGWLTKSWPVECSVGRGPRQKNGMMVYRTLVVI